MNTTGKPGVDWLSAAVEVLAQPGQTATVPIRDGDTSMLPTLGPGSQVAVQHPTEAPRRGELWLYRQEDYLVVHRLVGPARYAGRPTWRTRGDGRNRLDPHLEPERMLGRVVALTHAGAWRSLQGWRARGYGYGFAWHHLCWAVAGNAARGVDAILAKLGLRTRFGDGVSSVDQALLRVVHRLLFRAAHPRVTAPN